MGEANEQTQTGGTASHVGDCYIWAEVYYLDSATDYRECLPPRIQEAESDLGKLVMLDEVTPSSLWAVLRDVARKAAFILHVVHNNVTRLCLWIQN